MSYLSGKRCANCQFWDGSRKISSFKDRAEIKSFGEEGICCNNKSANTRGKNFRADKGFSCNYFEKWDELR